MASDIRMWVPKEKNYLVWVDMEVTTNYQYYFLCEKLRILKREKEHLGCQSRWCRFD
jgi:hypothetical protein